MPLFLKFIIFLTFIHTIQSHSVHPSPFAEARLLVLLISREMKTGAALGIFLYGQSGRGKSVIKEPSHLYTEILN
jgi:hypothetical protein